MTSPRTGQAGRIHVWVVFLAALIGVGGCTDDPPRPTTRSTPSASTPVFISERISWSPAHVIPLAEREQLQEVLGRIDSAVMVPTSPGPGEGPSTAEMTLQEAGEERSVTLAVRYGDTVFSVTATPGRAPCARRLQEDPQRWGTETIRGIQGCGLVGGVGEVSFLEWTEHETWFHVEWKATPKDRVLRWLSDWQALT